MNTYNAWQLQYNYLIYKKLLIRHQTENTDKQKTKDSEASHYLDLKIPIKKSKIRRTITLNEELVKKKGGKIQ